MSKNKIADSPTNLTTIVSRRFFRTMLNNHQPSLPPSFFAKNRNRLFAQLAAGSIAIFAATPEFERTNGVPFDYRPSSNILYLSNFTEPGTILVFSNLRGKRQFIMFVPEKDEAKETWNGFRHGTKGALEQFGADQAYALEEFPEKLATLIGAATNVYYDRGGNAIVDKQFDQVWNQNFPLHSANGIVHELRLFKSNEELAVMMHSAQISALAHSAGMFQCRAGKWEYQLQSDMEGICKNLGARAMAYPSIVAAGANATTLHYIKNGDRLADGLLLVDVGGEFSWYASDITRTYPINGRFNEAERAIYQLVLDAQQAAIKFARPGVTLNDVHVQASKVLRKGLHKLGILPDYARTKALEKKTLQEAKDKSRIITLKRYYMHNTSHWLGLDVHDVGDYKMTNDKRRMRKLEAGMVITVEPGLYFAKDDLSVPEQYRGIGVRIEDDMVIGVTVTRDLLQSGKFSFSRGAGNTVLSADLPSEISEIQKLMGQCVL